MRPSALLATLLALAPSTAQAGPQDFVVYISRLGGDTETARPYISKFAAHLEKAMGWPKGSCKGAFFADRKEALAAIKKLSPGFALLDPPLYFELRKAESLQPIAQLDGTEIVSSRMNLTVKDPALKSLEALKGKKLWTTLAESTSYLSKVVFDGKLDATKHFALKRVGHALKAIRAVLRGQADAALIDDDQLAAAKKMEGGDKLVVAYSSPSLPPLPVVVFGKVLKAADAKQLTKVVTTLCGSKDGAAVCKEMRLTRIAPVKLELFTRVEKKLE
jgi:ABC-type phosphate/phosphonate transport system substrate-binding protein